MASPSPSPTILYTICLVGFLIAPLSMAQNSPQDFVDTHNAVRAEVGVWPVSWDATLAAYAQNYANSKSETCEMVHSNGPYGENLAEGYGEMTAVEAVKFWATEKKFYDHRANRCVGDECGHYTQIVWRDSKRIGCARVKCENNWVFVICNYDPPGNYIGQLPY
ncbi:basic form of pathogenesis-related protein 1-like [Momordica charantia]|uniref:Basic form of pathogenesis-related protein 1-like n=1 Tax=Momordica charantia TaxID=3673 RepID=A0A6J1D615_MOMCH|nr:basic form of pathogenesis-related protein 1-like [Momordica charantia]